MPAAFDDLDLDVIKSLLYKTASIFALQVSETARRTVRPSLTLLLMLFRQRTEDLRLQTPTMYSSHDLESYEHEHGSGNCHEWESVQPATSEKFHSTSQEL